MSATGGPGGEQTSVQRLTLPTTNKQRVRAFRDVVLGWGATCRNKHSHL